MRKPKLSWPARRARAGTESIAVSGGSARAGYCAGSKVQLSRASWWGVLRKSLAEGHTKASNHMFVR